MLKVGLDVVIVRIIGYAEKSFSEYDIPFFRIRF